ncbi:MAG: MarR family transcriptional regulator [Sulfolobaceae archaeon]
MNIRDKILAYLYQKIEASIEEISNSIKEERDEVEVIVNRLKAEGLVIKKQKGLIRKKEVIALTPSGLEEAKKVFEKLEMKAKRIEEMIVKNGNDISALPAEVLEILPLLAALSLIDLALLQSIITIAELDLDNEVTDANVDGGDF